MRTTLTPAEAAVLDRVEAGEPTKVIAADLGLYVLAVERIATRARAVRARAESHAHARVIADTVESSEHPFGRPARDRTPRRSPVQNAGRGRGAR